MTDVVLVDTDVLFDVGRGIADAITSMQNAAKRSPLAVTVITQMELYIGCRNSTELRQVDRFLARFTIVPVNEQISDMAVDLVRHYRLSHGLLIPMR